MMKNIILAMALLFPYAAYADLCPPTAMDAKYNKLFSFVSKSDKDPAACNKWKLYSVQKRGEHFYCFYHKNNRHDNLVTYRSKRHYGRINLYAQPHWELRQNKWWTCFPKDGDSMECHWANI